MVEFPLGSNATRRWRTALVTIAMVFAFFCGARHASAQATAQVSGTVADSTGAVVPGAQVKITNTDTAAVRSTQSSADGTFNFPQLAIGPYRLEVTKDGFQTFAQAGIVLQVNTNPTIAVVLQVGNVSQTVEVEANAAMVETQNNSVGQVIEPEQVVDLPLNNRQPTQLISLAGGTVNTTANSGGLASNLDYPTAVSFSVAGSQRNGTNYILDGAANMDYRTNIGSPMPFPDALQEFKLETSTVPANSGSRPGGVVTALTKSGTNQIHGDVFEFLRNGVMDAAAYSFAGAKPAYDNLKRNQYGGVIGLPIKKDKLFFFYGLQMTNERQQLPAVKHIVPTTAMLQGDFRAFLAPPCQSSQQYLNINVSGNTTPLTTGTQVITVNGVPKTVSNNIISSSWLSTPSALLAAKIQQLYGAQINSTYGQATDQCGTQFTSPNQHDDYYEHVGRTDWQRTPSDSIFARYFITNYTNLSNPSVPGNILSLNGLSLYDRVQNIAIGDTHLLSPMIISTFRIDYNRTSTQRAENPTVPTLCQEGMAATCTVAHEMSALYLEPGYQGWDYENAFGIAENIGWQLGNHQLQFGFQGERVEMNGDGTFQVNPVLTFTSSGGATGNSDADWVTGNIDTLGQGNGQLSRDHQYMPSLYVQDNWKMTHTFQLNLGLRWDPYFPQQNKYGENTDFSIANYNNNVVSKQFVNAPPGMIFPGDAGSNGHSDTLTHALDFSPRVGFVWDPRGNGKQSIRGGYGIYYDTSLMWNAMHVVLNAPWGNTLSFTPVDALTGGGMANPYYQQSGGNIFPTPFNPPSTWAFNANGGYVFQDQSMKPSNAQQWNLSFQQQVGANWLFSASYIGSKTSHLWLGNNINPNVLITNGMTAPGIVSNSVVAGNPLSGGCTLLYEGVQVAFPTCNASAGTSVKVNINGQTVAVSSEAARRALNLSNPAQGYKMSGGITQAESSGNAAYNGLLVSLQHRLSNGFSINGNYTWSHCLDDGEVGQDIVPSFQNPANPKADWGNCSYDRRGIFNLSLVGQSPKFSNNWTERLAGNWNASGIFTASSGPYLNVVDGSDISLIGQSGVPGSSSFNDRPNQIGDPFLAGTVSGNSACAAPAQVHTAAHWFNNCAFAGPSQGVGTVIQTPGTFGNTARDSLLGPSVWNFDTAIWRTFPLTERFKLDFRGEAFNLFNHPQLSTPGVSLGSSSTLGQITSTSNNMRQLQVAAKIIF